MAFNREATLPSYGEAMERLGRTPSEETTKYDPSSPGHGVYRKRTNDDVFDEAGTGGARLQQDLEQPATISHTTVQPRYVQPETVLLPQTPTVSAPSHEPPGHFTKTKRYKKSISRSTSKRDTSAYAYDHQQSVDYWSSTSIEGVTINPNEPVVIQPMVTRVGPDGRTYLRDTSIVVVQPEDHETPNTKIVYGTPALPNEYKWYAILAMVCCFFFGVFSYMRAKQVREKFEARDFDGAQEASSSARNWGTVALMTGALIILVIIFLFFVSPCPLARAFQVNDICPIGT